MIDSFLKAFDGVSRMVDHCGWVGGKLAHEYFPPLLAEAQIFDCNGIKDAVIGDGSFEVEMYPDNAVPPHVDARLPAPVTVLGFDIRELKRAVAGYGDETFPTTSYDRIYVLRQLSSPSHFEVLNISQQHSPIRIGTVGGEKGWEPCPVLRKQTLEHANKRPEVTDPYAWKLYQEEAEKFLLATEGTMRRMCCLLQTMNTPRFLTIAPTGSRQVRRGASRGMGLAVDAWHCVSWDVDKPVNAKVPHDEAFHKLPLHFRRGHWRKADPDHAKSINRNGRWFTWIDGYWAGHPAFGFKKSYHQPKKAVAV